MSHTWFQPDPAGGRICYHTDDAGHTHACQVGTMTDAEAITHTQAAYAEYLAARAARAAAAG
jgi:hypothetical protein